MTTSPIRPGDPFDQEKNQQIVDAFRRDGYVHIPGVLAADEIAALLERTDELLDDPILASRENPDLSDRRYVQVRAHSDSGEKLPFILRNTIELDPIFRDMLVREPILTLAEAIVGPDCKFCGQNVLRNSAGVAIEQWHVDGAVHFPVPEDVPRHDPRIPPPVLWFTVQMAFTDIETIAHGPTQYVPGSHYSGRKPNSLESPEFEGRGPVSVFCRAGDIYLQDPQCWHRGAPNTSSRTRYLMQSQYAASWAYRRFGWMNRVPVPEADLRTASDRLLQVLGRRRPE
jgi:ectoine hydroxylase-related dioxygenase (phytanoyl-CoA dioxygenase family)